MKSVRIALLASAVLGLGAPAARAARVASPDPGFSLRDPGFLEEYAATYHFRYGRPAGIRVAPGGKAVFFLRSGPRSREQDLYELDPATGRERALLTAGSILENSEEALSPEERAHRERLREAARGIVTYRVSPDGTRLLVPLGGSLFIVDRASGAVRELASRAGAPLDPRFSPDGARIACVRGDEVYVTDLATGGETRVTTGACDTVTDGLAEFAAQEEMDRYRGFWWSPDSKRILFQRTRTSGMEVYHVGDPLDPSAEPQTWAYPRTGTRNARVGLGLVGADGGPVTWVRWDTTAYEYVTRVEWPDRGPLTVLVMNRAQNEERLLAVDPADGSTRTLLVERSPDWLDLFPRIPRWLPDGDRFLWVSGEGPWPELQLRGADGALLRTLAGDSLGFRNFEMILPAARSAVIQASTDPTRMRLYRVPLDPAGGPPVALTDTSGTASVASDGDGDVFVVSTESLTEEIRWRVAGASGLSATALRSTAEAPPRPPRVELTLAGPDPGFHVALVRPRDFEAGKPYPVLVSVYGGPGFCQVQARQSSYFLDQWMADQGFVVVTIDARGTPGRGRAWERATRYDLITLPLDDQAMVLRKLEGSYPELDLGRVGIWGGSFGGYFAAMAVLRRPDVFRAGVAISPVTDWRDYDTFYTERHMGLPAENPEGYRRTSCLTYAAGLRRPLLLIHGTDDDNVYYVNSMKLADALLRAGKAFDFLPLPHLTHMTILPPVATAVYTRVVRFFSDALER